jgi:hypothetical protein
VQQARAELVRVARVLEAERAQAHCQFTPDNVPVIYG